MASPNQVEVCIGRNEKVGTIARPVLLRFDRTANSVFAKNGYLTTRRLFRSTDADAVRAVIAWMQSQANSNHPRPLQPPGSPRTESDFVQLVHLHAACYAFFIPRELRGDTVRRLILDYIDMAPLTSDEFIMIAGFLFFDQTLLRQATVATCKFKRVGDERGFRGVPQWERIEAYCRDKGIELNA